MTKEIFLERMADILDVEDEITLDTNLSELEEWDSLSQIQLVVAIERELGIKFNSKEITTWKNVGEMVDMVFGKVSE